MAMGAVEAFLKTVHDHLLDCQGEDAENTFNVFTYGFTSPPSDWAVIRSIPYDCVPQVWRFMSTSNV